MESSQPPSTNPYLGEKAPCEMCRGRRHHTTNRNRICPRHPAGSRNLVLALRWELGKREQSRLPS